MHGGMFCCVALGRGATLGSAALGSSLGGASLGRGALSRGDSTEGGRGAQFHRLRAN